MKKKILATLVATMTALSLVGVAWAAPGDGPGKASSEVTAVIDDGGAMETATEPADDMASISLEEEHKIEGVEVEDNAEVEDHTTSTIDEEDSAEVEDRAADSTESEDDPEHGEIGTDD